MALLDTRIQCIDWTDAKSVHELGGAILQELSQRDVLNTLLDRFEADLALQALSEVGHVLDSITLAQFPFGARLRLHAHHRGDRMHVHEHRWNFCSILLSGSWEQVIYANQGDERTPVFEPLCRLNQAGGEVYSLLRPLFHETTCVAPNTVSLMLRGPALSQRSLHLDRASGACFWHDAGAGHKTPSQRQMTIDDLSRIVRAARASLA